MVDELIFEKSWRITRAIEREETKGDSSRRRATPIRIARPSSSILRSRFSLSLVRCNVTSMQLPSRDACTDDLTVAGTADTSIYGDIDNHTDLTAPILGTMIEID